jgi:hypothetical protein
LDYQSLLELPDTPERQLQRLETLNVFSLNRSWLGTFLKALDQDLPDISGPFTLDVNPAAVQVGTTKHKRAVKEFSEYQQKLLTFKVGRSEFDAPLKAILNKLSHEWQWCYQDGKTEKEGGLLPFQINLDYRANKTENGQNIVEGLKAALAQYTAFMMPGHLTRQLTSWSLQQRVQFYVEADGVLNTLSLAALLPLVAEVKYDHALDSRSLNVIERIAEEVQRDVLDKVFHKIRYVIDKGCYRYETIRQAANGVPGDFIERYTLSYEFKSLQDKQKFEANAKNRLETERALKENRGDYHIYEPLLGEADEGLLKPHKLKRIGISPDKLNAGEKKFLADILKYIDEKYSRDSREFYLMRNVESLRSIGLYLEGETRVFYPDFVLWIIDDKANKTTIALFDPKGQTGILDESGLGIDGGDAMNEKVRIATSGQLAELARELISKSDRSFAIHSFILLRDTSPLGKTKGSGFTDKEETFAVQMIKKNVLRLDWYDKNEAGQNGVKLPDGSSYLTKIFEVIG